MITSVQPTYVSDRCVSRTVPTVHTTQGFGTTDSIKNASGNLSHAQPTTITMPRNPPPLIPMFGNVESNVCGSMAQMSPVVYATREPTVPSVLLSTPRAITAQPAVPSSGILAHDPIAPVPHVSVPSMMTADCPAASTRVPASEFTLPGPRPPSLSAHTTATPSLYPVHSQTIVPQVKLPKLTMKKFNGDLTKWATFWDSFCSSIHSNPTLSSIDKFNYLSSLLDSTAAEAIAG